MGREKVRITIDTNVLVRAVMRDDEKQGRVAATLLRRAEIVAVPLACLCEFVWVLRKVYGLARDDIAAALEVLLDSANVAVDRAAAEVGLAVLRAGGDFADGVIAHEGAWLGGDIFASFDATAVALLSKTGRQTRLLA